MDGFLFKWTAGTTVDFEFLINLLVGPFFASFSNFDSWNPSAENRPMWF